MIKMAATVPSISSHSVVNQIHYGVNSQSVSAPSAVTVQVLSSSPATPVVSRGGSVDNGTVGYIWSVYTVKIDLLQ